MFSILATSLLLPTDFVVNFYEDDDDAIVDEFGNLVDVPKSGFTSVQLRHLTKRRRVKDLGEKVQLERCLICLEDFKKSMIVCEMPCSHYFHVPCIETWCKNNKTCPLCKHEMNEPAVEVRNIPERKCKKRRTNNASDE